jgi:hypothetical protein
MKRIVLGEYNRCGYTVLLCQRGLARTVYTAGNHHRDSQQQALPGVCLRQLRKFCIRTCREIAGERHARYGGVTRVCEENA